MKINSSASNLSVLKCFNTLIWLIVYHYVHKQEGVYLHDALQETLKVLIHIPWSFEHKNLFSVSDQMTGEPSGLPEQKFTIHVVPFQGSQLAFTHENPELIIQSVSTWEVVLSLKILFPFVA